ncbi:MAG TPA: S8 family serine peptidase [Steroidobacteraceae bacterium]|nr:S8 family serine peptidase [Steroidobacteraceae bacterium]
MSPSSALATVLLLIALAQSDDALAADEHNPVARESRGQPAPSTLAVIIKLRKDGAGAPIAKLDNGTERTAALAKRTGLALGLKREISESLLASHVELGDASAQQILERLRADPAIEYVSLDRRRFPHAMTPNDTLFANQWYLKDTEPSAVNAIVAWDRETGSTGVVIAVLDTGVLYDHPDLGRADRGGKLLPGFDFVSAQHMSNDGDGRDADPSDPGDWVDSIDKANTAYADCGIESSSWHGTRVAGMVGALTNNAAGVAGINWNSFILPVRVLGKCGGVDSDILAGMRWAAGLHVAGVPDNPTPARILNASLGDDGACEPSYRDVITEITARKVLLVVSAGNEATVVSSPANCPGVAAVAAIRHAGSKVGFSSLGPEVTLAAPGGNCVNIDGGPCLFSLDTTSNSGTKAPANHIFTDQTNSNLGTSFSAPIVSGIAALMLSRNANLSTTQMLSRLREGTRPFPTTVAGEPLIEACHVPVNNQDFQGAQCLCTTSTCGAGMANAALSVAAAERPIAAVALPVNVSAGQNVLLNASASAAACGRTLAIYAWSVVDPSSNPPPIVGASTSIATVIAPAVGSITVRLTVTDDQGRADSADVVVSSNSATSNSPPGAGSTPCAAPVTSGPTPGGSTPAPPPTPDPAPPRGGGSSGGGGGSIGLTTLFLLGLLLLARDKRWQASHISRCNC